ncbi:MAG: patatin-like phospholipase family protein [Peptococcaceae bacterium]|nr:patatin-like phospholipase family protein [Peptococcaceae bacterium]
MYGLVLEGGGARGSYQIGACKAIHELGIEIGAVAGTSIGALNGAMIVQGELERAYQLWYNISPSQVFDIEEGRLEELKNLEISHDGFLYFMRKAKEIAQSKGLDITFIKKLLQEIIIEKKLRDSKITFGFVTVSLSEMKPLELFLDDIPEGKVAEYLMASANLPAFKQEKIDGKHFMDGGFYDNLPLNMLARKGYKNIIAVRTKALGRTRKISDQTVKIKYIASEDNLGRILDFNQAQARFNLQLGYYDALKSFRDLKGVKYYIKPTGDEELFLNFLLSPGEEAILKLGGSMGFTGVPYRRLLFEHIVPKLGLLLDVGKEGGYEEVAIASLELLAANYGVERFRIYSFHEFVDEIKKNSKKSKPVRTEEGIRLPGFVRQSDVLSRAVKDRIAHEIVEEFFGEYLRNAGIAQ